MQMRASEPDHGIARARSMGTRTCALGHTHLLNNAWMALVSASITGLPSEALRLVPACLLGGFRAVDRGAGRDASLAI